MASPPSQEKESNGRVAWLAKPVRRAALHAMLVSLVAHDLNATRRMKVISVQAYSEIQPVERDPLAISRLLLVEDNPVNQEVALAILQELGLKADCAWDGEEALEKLGAARYDVVLMDCHMPKLDGYATTRRLRESEAAAGNPRTPVIALTANALNGDAEQCFAAGMDGYLSKPFSIDELYVTLKPYERNAQVGSRKRAAAPRAGNESVPETRTAARDRQPPTRHSGSALDEQALKKIRSLRRPGDPDLLKRIVDLYITNSRTLIDSLRGAIIANNAPGVVQAAHSLKSSSANVGATGPDRAVRGARGDRQDRQARLCVGNAGSRRRGAQPGAARTQCADRRRLKRPRASRASLIGESKLPRRCSMASARMRDYADSMRISHLKAIGTYAAIALMPGRLAGAVHLCLS